MSEALGVHMSEALGVHVSEALCVHVSEALGVRWAINQKHAFKRKRTNLSTHKETHMNTRNTLNTPSNGFNNRCMPRRIKGIPLSSDK